MTSHLDVVSTGTCCGGFYASLRSRRVLPPHLVDRDLRRGNHSLVPIVLCVDDELLLQPLSDLWREETIVVRIFAVHLGVDRRRENFRQYQPRLLPRQGRECDTLPAPMALDTTFVRSAVSLMHVPGACSCTFRVIPPDFKSIPYHGG